MLSLLPNLSMATHLLNEHWTYQTFDENYCVRVQLAEIFFPVLLFSMFYCCWVKLWNNDISFTLIRLRTTKCDSGSLRKFEEICFIEYIVEIRESIIQIWVVFFCHTEKGSIAENVQFCSGFFLLLFLRVKMCCSNKSSNNQSLAVFVNVRNFDYRFYRFFNFSSIFINGFQKLFLFISGVHILLTHYFLNCSSVICCPSMFDSSQTIFVAFMLY